MSDDLIGRGVVEVVGNTDDVTAKIAKVGDDVEKMARRAVKSGKDASDGIKQVGDGAKKATDGLDDATKKFEAGLKKQIAALSGAKKGTEEYVRAQAKLKGADLAALEPIIKQYASVKRSAEEAAKATRNVADQQKFLDDLGRRTDGIGKTASQLARLKAEQLGVAKEAAPMIARMEQAERAANRTGGAFSKLSGYVQAAAAAFGVRELLKFADGWGQLASRMDIATGSTQAGAQALSELMVIANRVYKPIEEVSEVFISTKKTLDEMGYSAADTMRTVEALSYALTVSGADAQKSTSVMDAWSKAILSGKMNMQQFTSIIAGAPRLQEALAASLNTTNAGLMEMVKSGKLTADQMMKVGDQVKKLGEETDHMPVSISDAFTKLRNSLSAFMGDADKSVGVIRVITSAVEALADNLNVVATAATTLMGLKVAQWMTASGVAAAGLTGALKAAALAARGFFVAIGPIGWTVLAVGSLVALWQKFSDKLEGAAQIARTVGATWDAVVTIISDGFRSVWEYASEFFNVVQDKPKEAARDMGQAFQDGVIAAAQAIDDLSKGITGTMAAVGAVFVTVAKNMEIVFKNAFHRVLEMASEWVHDLATQLNRLPGVNIETSMYVGPGKFRTKDVFEEARRAYAASSKGFGLADAIRSNIETRELKAIFDGMGESADRATKAIKNLGEESSSTGKKISEAQKAAEAFAKQRESDIRSQYEQISAIHLQAQAVEDQVALFGLSKTAIDALTISRLEEQATILRGFKGSEQQVELIEQEIEARKRLMAAGVSLEARQAEQKAREEYEAGWKETTDSIGQSLTDALLRGFESGKSFAQNMKDTVVNMFKTMVLKPIIQPILTGVAGSVLGMLGLSGPANAATGGALGNLGGLSNFLGGGSLSEIVSSGISFLGEKFGSSAMQSFASGMQGLPQTASWAAPDLVAPPGYGAQFANVLDIGGQILGYGKAIFDVTKGNYGSAIGSAIGTYVLPGIGTAVGSVLGGFADKLFGSKDTRHGGTYIWEAGRGYSQHDGGWQSGNPGAEVGNAVNQMVQSAAEMANRAFNAVGSEIFVSKMHGILESSEKDRGGTASGGWIVGVGGLTAAEAASYVPGRDDPLAWLPGPDGGRRFGTFGRGQGHGEQSGDLQQMMEWLAVDLQQSIIESWQVGIDAFPSIIRDMIGGIDPNSLDASQSAALVQQVISTIDGVKAAQAALAELPMQGLSNLSFDAAASLLKVAGSIENLIGVIQTYNDAAFTDAEKLERAQGRLSDAFAQLGLEVPTSVQALRALVDAQGMATEEDQRRTLALMSLAPALVEVTAAAEAMAERMRGLTTTYFSLFKSAQEQYDLAARDLAAQFEKLGYTLPKTASEYTYLVDSIDMSTASSRALKEQLLALAQPMRTLIDQAAELAKAAGESVKTGFSVNEIYEQQIAIVEQLRAKVAGLSAEVQTAFANRAMAQSLSAQISEALGQGASTAARQADLWNQVRADITPGQRLDAAQELIGLLTHIPAPDTSTQQAAVAAAQEARAVAQEQRSAAQAAMSAAQQQLSAAKSLQDAGRRLREYVQGLRSSDLSPLTMAEKVAEAAGHYQRTLSAAQGGDEEALRNLQSVSSTYLDLARQFYASNQAYTDIFNSVTGALDGLGAGLLGQGNSAASIAQSQLSAAEAALAAAEQQILAAEQQIATAQSQLEVARVGNGLTADQISQLKSLQEIVGAIEADADASFKSLSAQLGEELALLDSMEKALGLQSTVPGLLAGLPAGIAAALAPLLDANANKYVQGLYQEFLSRPADQGGMDYWRDQFSQGTKGLNDYLWSANEEMIHSAYKQVLGRDADAQGLEHYARQMQSGKSIEDIIKELEWAKAHGSHAAGLPYVPFDGYRAELHKGERVLTAQENREYSAINWNRYGRGDDAMRAVVAELRAVKQEVSELRAQQAQASATDTQVQLQVGEKVARAVQSGIAEGVETGRTRNVRLA